MAELSSINCLTEAIIDSIIHVHKVLGPGFGENVYKNALEIELRDRSLAVEREKQIHLFYKNAPVGLHRLDLVVEKRVILELKAVDAIHRNHYAQIRAYMKASGIGTGLVVNFAGHKADYRRVSTNDAE